MTAERAAKILPIYERQLAVYEARNDAARVKVQRALIARLKRKASK